MEKLHVRYKVTGITRETRFSCTIGVGMGKVCEFVRNNTSISQIIIVHGEVIDEATVFTEIAQCGNHP